MNCNKDAIFIDEMYFSIRDNGIKCINCARLEKYALKINQATYSAMLYILASEPKKIFSFEIPEEALKELSSIAKLYTNEKLEKEYKVAW